MISSSGVGCMEIFSCPPQMKETLPEALVFWLDAEDAMGIVSLPAVKQASLHARDYLNG